jgi:hypothetical protein
MGTLYYDRQGKPISMERYCQLAANPEYKRVGESKGCGKWVSTVWLGINHSYGGGPPIIFETMVFPLNQEGDVNYGEIDSDRYATEEEALEGHRRMCSGYTDVLDRFIRKVDGVDGVDGVDSPDRL